MSLQYISLEKVMDHIIDQRDPGFLVDEDHALMHIYVAAKEGRILMRGRIPNTSHVAILESSYWMYSKMRFRMNKIYTVPLCEWEPIDNFMSYSDLAILVSEMEKVFPYKKIENKLPFCKRWIKLFKDWTRRKK